MSLAILCAGHGGPHPEMFASTHAQPEAEFLFTHATRLLDGHDPRELVSAQPSASLYARRTVWILGVLQTLAATAVLRRTLPNPLIVAGHGVGEIAAWGVAGWVSMTDALDVVAGRMAMIDLEVKSANATLIRAGERFDKLAPPMSHTEHWGKCLQGCVAAGATAFLELGSACVVNSAAMSEFAGIPARCLEDFESLQAAREWIVGLSAETMVESLRHASRHAIRVT